MISSASTSTFSSHASAPWKQALSLLLKLGSKSSTSSSTTANISSSTSLLHEARTSKLMIKRNKQQNEKNKTEEEMDQRSDNQDQEQQQQNDFINSANSTLSKWIRENIKTNPTAVITVSKLLLKNQNKSNNNTYLSSFSITNLITPELRKEILNSISSPERCVRTNEEIDETKEIVKSLVVVSSSSFSVTAGSEAKMTMTTPEKMKMMSAIARTPWDDHRASSSSSSSLTASMDLFNAINGNNKDFSSSNETSTTKRPSDVASAIFIRSIAPQILKRASSSSSKFGFNRDSFLTHHQQISPEYLDFLEEAANQIANNKSEQKNDLSLRQKFDLLPEKRPLYSVLGRVLIQRKQWSEALQMLSEEAKLIPKETKNLSFTQQQMISVKLGLEAAILMSNDDDGHQRHEQEQMLQSLLSSSAITSLPLKISTAKSILKLANASKKETEETLAKILSTTMTKGQGQEQQQNQHLETSGVAVSEPTNEIEAEEAALSTSLALSLSSTWQQALQDFSMITLSSVMFSETSGVYGVVRDTLAGSKTARKRVMRGLIDGGKIDMLKTVMKVLGDNNKNNNKLSPSSPFTNREAVNIILKDFGIKKRDVGSLRYLRDSWPTEYSSTLALKVELRLRAKKLMPKIVKEIRERKNNDTSDKQQQNVSLKQKLEMMKKQAETQVKSGTAETDDDTINISNSSASSPSSMVSLTKEIDQFLQLSSLIFKKGITAKSEEEQRTANTHHQQQKTRFGNTELRLINEISELMISNNNNKKTPTTDQDASSSSSLSLLHRQFLQRYNHSFKQARSWKTMIEKRRSVISSLQQQDNSSSNNNFNQDLLATVFDQALDAKLPSHHNQAQTVFDKLSAKIEDNKNNRNHHQQQKSTKNNKNDQQIDNHKNIGSLKQDSFWKKVTFEISRLSSSSSSKEAKKSFMKCLTNIVAHHHSADGQHPNIIISDNLLHQLALKEKRIQSLSHQYFRSKNAKRHFQNTFEGRLMADLRREQKLLSSTILNTLSDAGIASSPSSSTVSSREKTLTHHRHYHHQRNKLLSRKRHALCTLVKNTEVDTTNSNGSNSDHDELKSKILFEVSKSYVGGAIDDEQEQQHNSSTSNSTTLKIQNFDVVVSRGWVEGADDVAKTAAKSFALKINIEQNNNDINDNTTIKTTSAVAVNQNQLLWLLQQSSEVRQFVKEETDKILAGEERKTEKLESSSVVSQKYVSPQTINASIWRCLVKVFEGVIQTLSSENNNNSNKTKNNNNKSLLVISSCADILQKEGKLGQSVVPFCLDRALFKCLSSSSSSDENNTDNNANEDEFKLRKNEMILNACHIQNDKIRWKLLKCINSNKDEDARVRFERMAVVEGIMMKTNSST